MSATTVHLFTVIHNVTSAKPNKLVSKNLAAAKLAVGVVKKNYNSQDSKRILLLDARAVSSYGLARCVYRVGKAERLGCSAVAL